MSDPFEFRESPEAAERSRAQIKADAEKVTPGLKGNLIVNAFAVKSDKNAKKTKRQSRPTPLGMLPAIPFEVIAPTSTK